MSQQKLGNWLPGSWVAASGGNAPPGSVPAGKEADGKPLFVARAKCHGGLHPGKVRQEFGAANIPYGGNEIKVNDYEVFVPEGRWVAASGGNIPQGAQVAGYEADGTALYVCRAKVAGGVHPGKVRPQFGAANIPYGHKEIKVTDYEVLVAELKSGVTD